MKDIVLQIKDAICWKCPNLFRKPINIELERGRIYIMYGPNGCGKTILAETMAGHCSLKQGKRVVKSEVAFMNCSRTKEMMGNEYYHQQRWNATDQESLPLVSSLLPQLDSLSPHMQSLWQSMNIDPLLDKRIIHLSSGELCRLQISQMIFSGAGFLILDDMFVGLDTPTAGQLQTTLTSLSREAGITFLLTMPDKGCLPSWADSFIFLSKDGPTIQSGEVLTNDGNPQQTPEADKDLQGAKSRILSLPNEKALIAEGEEIVSMKDVAIEYDGHRILSLPEFSVRSGEKWAITGNNGSGKSTLFSIICADNPQSYSCRLRLFGRDRGSGESIWDIKKNIGFVSPELHRAYSRQLRAVYVVATGFDQYPGAGLNPTEQELWQSQWWMQTLGILHLYRSPFSQLSFGEQQMVLIARSLVKDPPLLVLDEPMQGLDAGNIAVVREVIGTFCSRPGKSLIMITHDPSELPSNIDHRLHFPIQRK